MELVARYEVTCTQRQIDEADSNGSSSSTKMIRLLMAVFFSEEEMVSSSYYSSGKTENQLDDNITAAYISKTYVKYTCDYILSYRVCTR